MSNTMSNNNNSSLMAINIGRVSGLAFIAVANVVVTPVEAGWWGWWHRQDPVLLIAEDPVLFIADEWQTVKGWDGLPNAAISVTGYVQIEFDSSESTEGTYTWALDGVDPDCKSSDQIEDKNQCGIHVHWGVSCDEATGVEGHMFVDGETDPWGETRYTSSGTSGTQSNEFRLEINDGVRGRFHDTNDNTSINDDKSGVMVLHDSVNKKFACSPIRRGADDDEKLKLKASNFQKLADYDGDHSINADELNKSKVKVSFRSRKSSWGEYEWDLKSVDPRCTNPFDLTANYCGIHVHWGTSCDDYGLHMSYTYDPWGQIRFQTKNNKQEASAKGIFIDDGVKGYKHATRGDRGKGSETKDSGVIVLHDADGQKFACSVIDVVQ